MDINRMIMILLLLVLIVLIIYFALQYLRGKKAAEALSAEEFKKNLRRVQLIDLREKKDYDKGHILGARNIPLAQLNMRIEELRRDKPVYLYEEGEAMTRRAALLLKKAGFSDLYRLEGGYEAWSGKIKKNK